MTERAGSRLLRALRGWLDGTDLPPAPAYADAWRRLQHRIDAAAYDRPYPAARGRGAGSPWRRVAYASAGIAAVIGVLFAIRQPTTTRAVVERSYATTAGQFAAIDLADGSRIMLAPRSRLTIARDGARRIARLVGEARFTVTPDPKAPFVVRSGEATIRVLGTTFEVRHYADEATSRIIVHSGRIAAERDGRTITVAAGMTGIVGDSAVTALAGIDSSVYADWSAGRLMFHDAPVPLFLATLRRWYGYSFAVSDSTILASNVTTTFTIGKTTEMFSLVKRLLDVNLTFKDSTVTLHVNRDGRGRSRGASRDLFLPSHTSTEVGR